MEKVRTYLVHDLCKTEAEYLSHLRGLEECCKLNVVKDSRLFDQGVRDQQMEQQLEKGKKLHEVTLQLLRKHEDLQLCLEQTRSQIDLQLSSFLDWLNEMLKVYSSYIQWFHQDTHQLASEAHLKRRPLVRIRYLQKFISKLSECSTWRLGYLKQALDGLLQAARQKDESERHNSKFHSIDFSNVKCLESMAVVGATFDSHKIRHRDAAQLRLSHPEHGTFDYQIEIIGVKYPSSDSLEQIALCNLEEANSSLLFPPFTKHSLKLGKISENFIVLDHATNPHIKLSVSFKNSYMTDKWAKIFHDFFTAPTVASASNFKGLSIFIPASESSFNNKALPPVKSELHQSRNLSPTSASSEVKIPHPYSRNLNLKGLVTTEDTSEVSEVKEPRSDETFVFERTILEKKAFETKPIIYVSSADTKPSETKDELREIEVPTTPETSPDDVSDKAECTTPKVDLSAFAQYKPFIEAVSKNDSIKKSRRKSLFSAFTLSKKSQKEKPNQLKSLYIDSTDSLNKPIVSDLPHTESESIYEQQNQSNTTLGTTTTFTTLKATETCNGVSANDIETIVSKPQMQLQGPFAQSTDELPYTDERLTQEEEHFLTHSIPIITTQARICVWRNNLWENVDPAGNTLTIKVNVLSKQSYFLAYEKGEEMPSMMISLSSDKVKASSFSGLDISLQSEYNKYLIRCQSSKALNSLLSSITRPLLEDPQHQLQPALKSKLSFMSHDSSASSAYFSEAGTAATSMTSISAINEDILSLGKPNLNIVIPKSRNSSAVSLVSPQDSFFNSNSSSYDSLKSKPSFELLLLKNFQVVVNNIKGRLFLYSLVKSPDFFKLIVDGTNVQTIFPSSCVELLTPTTVKLGLEEPLTLQFKNKSTTRHFYDIVST
ncbi:hypothetical protein LJB42_004340 [Komagataella kurtzmanii]|nr:hypothetical protein LJB42_004340 [Komagataella kurtzmanii]